MNENTLRIGAVARGADADVATVRRYVALGLVTATRDSNGGLLFASDAVQTVRNLKAQRLAHRGRKPA
jgi:DNA-binding transcriptional MerR regulator